MGRNHSKYHKRFPDHQGLKNRKNGNDDAWGAAEVIKLLIRQANLSMNGFRYKTEALRMANQCKKDPMWGEWSF